MCCIKNKTEQTQVRTNGTIYPYIPNKEKAVVFVLYLYSICFMVLPTFFPGISMLLQYTSHTLLVHLSYCPRTLFILSPYYTRTIGILNSYYGHTPMVKTMGLFSSVVTNQGRKLFKNYFFVLVWF
jgi:hypothetical protein